MSSGELVGRQAEQQLGRTRMKLRADRTTRLRDIAKIIFCARAAGDGTGDHAADLIGVIRK
jgi:hypothetical protein